MAVEDWFDSWRDRLRGRIRDPKGGWPEDGEEWWEGVISWMERRRVQPGEGDALLDRLQEEGLPYNNLDNLISTASKLLNRIRKDQAESAFEGEGARRECLKLGCECGGMGLVSRDHYRADYGTFSVSYYCPGPMGRHVQQAHRAKKLPELASVVGSKLERVEDDTAFSRQADPRHVRIGRWFASRAAARVSGRPLPPDPPEVIEIERAYRQRNAPIHREAPKAPPFVPGPEESPHADS